MSELREYVEILIAKAGKAKDANDALKFSQAAMNAANAMCALRDAESGGYGSMASTVGEEA